MDAVQGQEDSTQAVHDVKSEPARVAALSKAARIALTMPATFS